MERTTYWVACAADKYTFKQLGVKSLLAAKRAATKVFKKQYGSNRQVILIQGKAPDACIHGGWVRNSTGWHYRSAYRWNIRRWQAETIALGRGDKASDYVRAGYYTLPDEALEFKATIYFNASILKPLAKHGKSGLRGGRRWVRFIVLPRWLESIFTDKDIRECFVELTNCFPHPVRVVGVEFIHKGSRILIKETLELSNDFPKGASKNFTVI